MNRIILFMAITFLVSGCSWLIPDPIIQTKTVEVKVPIYLKAEVPDVLKKATEFVLPVFQGPGSEGMSSCLNIEGEAKMKHLMIELNDRERAWQEWSK